MTASETAIEFKSVTKKFGRRCALNNLTMRVPKDTICGLVGSNGAGKTTSFAVATGLLRAESGQINLLGEGPFDPVKHAGRIAMMPQDASLPLYARVRDVLAFYARLQGIPKRQIRDEVEKVIEWVNLTDRANALVRTLSHGMRRRVVVAQAFLGSPELIMLDEPMGGLDPREVVNIRNLLVRKVPGQTILISSHNLHELELVCEEVAFIDKGRLMRQEPMDKILGHEETVHIVLASGETLSLSDLEQHLPDISFEWEKEGKVLICHYPKGDRPAPEFNETILKTLFEQKVGVLEVRRGRNLESAYIHHSESGTAS